MKNTYKLLGMGEVIVVTTFDGKKHNVAPFAWHTPLDFDPFMLGAVIASSSKTFANIKKTGECVINILTADKAKLVHKLGQETGFTKDKMKGPNTFSAKKVKPLCLEGIVAWIEMEMVEVIKKYDLSILKARTVYARKGAFGREGELNLRKYPTLHHLGGKNSGSVFLDSDNMNVIYLFSRKRVTF